MLQRMVVSVLVLVLAFGVLVVSFFKTSSVEYAFSQEPNFYLDTADGEVEYKVDYNFTYPGSVHPDHALWLVKAARDKLWLMVNRDPKEEFRLYLLFADKRLMSSEVLLDRDKYELSVSTLTKAAKYLEKALGQLREMDSDGIDVDECYEKLALASLAHRLRITEMFMKYPEDAKPVVVEVMDYSKRVYFESCEELRAEGIEIPEASYSERE